ncbi:hypothetical protein FMEXI_12530 [Fusarium mexicanum]|uniref:Uncharacterized protein n=1 Tax=Fusarium mexicanum TaxID=751941 RepID=A0A8H5I9Y6_9HYPO|nr:hypothetical protein FMEXI_12530 [Fusarium mexicanum]
MENTGRCNKLWVGRHPDDVNHVMNHLYRGQPNLPSAVDEYDADAEEIDLNEPNVPAYLSLVEDCWDYIVQPLMNALRPLRGLPYFLIMPIYFLVLNLYCIITGMDGPFLRQIIPVILVEVAERYEPGAGFFVNVVVGLMPHIWEQLRPTLEEYGGRLSDLYNEFEVFIILIGGLEMITGDSMKRGLSMSGKII